MRYFSIIVVMVITFSACNNSASPTNSGTHPADTVSVVGTYDEREQNNNLFLAQINEPSFDTITEMGKHHYRVIWEDGSQPKLRMVRLVFEGDSVLLVYKKQYWNDNQSEIIIDTVYNGYLPASFGVNFTDYLDSANFKAMPESTGAVFYDADMLTIESAYVFINPAFVDSRDFRKVQKVKRYLGEDKRLTEEIVLLFEKLDALIKQYVNHRRQF